MLKEQLMLLAKSKAAEHHLPPEIVCAVVEQESGWNTWAIRAESGYRWLWDYQLEIPFRHMNPFERASANPPPDFGCPAYVSKNTEWWGQKTSWGLMQVMGAVARERGFKGKFLSELCDPETNLEFGCLHLLNRLSFGKGDWTRGLLAWNGGGNKEYAKEVLAKAEKYKKPIAISA